MTKQELRDRLDARPFAPFRVNTSDGKHYDVTDPQMAVPTQTRLFIVFEHGGFADIDLARIESVKPLAPPKSAGMGAEIEQIAWAKPFKPFRLKIAGGQFIDVTRPHQLVVMAKEVFVVLPSDRWKFVPLQQITGVEMLPA